MEERNVRYIRMPDLNDKDGFVQLAVYGEDQLNFQGWYDRFLMARMQGGEHELQNLNNLTNGRTSIVSIPMEQEVDLLKADFDTLQVNYSILPDLNIGDGGNPGGRCKRRSSQGRTLVSDVAGKMSVRRKAD